MKNYGLLLLTIVLIAGCTGIPTAASLTQDLGKALEGEVKEIAKKDPLKTASGLEVNEENIVNAVKEYDMVNLEALLAQIDDVRTVVSDDVLLLHMAEEAAGISGQEIDMTKLLVKKKAWIMQRDSRGKSFISVINAMELSGSPREQYANNLIGDKFDRYYAALRADSVEEIKALTDFMPKDGRMLYDAVHAKAAGVVGFLIQAGVPLESISAGDNGTALHEACDGYPYDFSFDRRLDLTQVLLDAGVPVNGKNDKGQTPLAKLLDSESRDNQDKMGSPRKLAELLIRNGASVNIVDNQGFSLVFLAINSRSPELLSLLLKNGAAIDEKSYTSGYLYGESLRILSENGGDISILAGKVSSVLEPSGLKELIDHLLSRGASPGDFNLNSLYSNFEMVAYLVVKGADVDGSNVLVNAVMNYVDLERIEFLVEHGADLTRKYVRGKKILHLAVQAGNMEVVQYLVEQGAELNAADEAGKTPLDYCNTRKTALMEYLVSGGAKSASQL